MTLDSLLCFYEKGSTCVHALVSMKKKKKSYKRLHSFQKYPFLLVLSLCGSIFLSLQKVKLSLSLYLLLERLYVSSYGDVLYLGRLLCVHQGARVLIPKVVGEFC